MRTVYETFNENALDAALVITEHEALEAPAKVESIAKKGQRRSRSRSSCKYA